jgi:Cd2+/Zn2+-exporting ATPase
MQKFDGELPEGIKAEEVAGKGVKAEADGKVILAGNTKLMAENGVKVTDNPAGGGTVVYVAADGRYEGFIRISDTVKSDSKSAIAGLKDTGVHTFMLTGDRKESADATAKELGIDEYAAELLPGDKVTKLESIMESGKITAFVGDGINDAPVLMRADVGIAMGALGSDAAIEAADVVLMTDEPSKISEAIKISRKTVSIVNQNIIFALGVKLLILILTAFGLTTMWIAVFGDVGVAFIAILNAMRARKA